MRTLIVAGIVLVALGILVWLVNREPPGPPEMPSSAPAPAVDSTCGRDCAEVATAQRKLVEGVGPEALPSAERTLLVEVSDQENGDPLTGAVVTLLAGDEPGDLSRSDRSATTCASVSGVVLDAAGAPVPRVEVRWFRAVRDWNDLQDQERAEEERRARRYPAFDWDHLDVTERTMDAVLTEPDGRFRLEIPGPGSVPLFLEARHPVLGLTVCSEAIRMEAPASVTDVVLRFPASGTGNVKAGRATRKDLEVREWRTTISGRVVSPTGQPVSALVHLEIPNESGLWHGEQQTSEGRFHFHVPHEGGTDCTLTARTGNDTTAAMTEPVAVHAGDEDLVFMLPDRTWTRLRILDADRGISIPRVRLSWRMVLAGHAVASRNEVDWQPGLDGAEDHRLPIGRMTLTLDASEFGYPVTDFHDFEVQANSTGHRELRLRRAP